MLELTGSNTASASVVSQQLAHDLAAEAFIFGYPLVLTDLTRRGMTNVPKAGETAAPVNQFANMRSFPDDTMTAVVSPNADTLYSFAFLDLSLEPMVLSIPEMGSRYYLMEMLDGWTNVFACPGTRTIGSGKADFVVTGPAWTGTLPAKTQEIQSPTSLVWIIGRTQTNGKDDYAAVNAIQDQYRLTPLSAWGEAYAPPDKSPVDQTVEMKVPPVEQVARMDATTFFGRLNALMKENPPAPGDAEALQRFAAIGVAPGKTFDLRLINRAIAKGIEQGVFVGQVKIMAEIKKPHGRIANGWQSMSNLGRYETDYLWRAVVAMIGLGANLPEDAVYHRRTVDAEDQPLTGANNYEIHFLKGEIPPVNGFWSITLYNSGQFFARNPINRFAIGDRDRLQFNDDGSLTLFVQNQSPGLGRESNWLPAPSGSFNLIMRLYWPRQEVLDGVWRPPQVKRRVATVMQAA